jgi:hypothetical protein
MQMVAELRLKRNLDLLCCDSFGFLSFALCKCLLKFKQGQPGKIVRRHRFAQAARQLARGPLDGRPEAE